MAGKIYRLGKGLEQDFDNVVRFFPIEQFQMQIATRLVCETLKEFARQPKPKSARHVLTLFLFADAFELQLIQAAPNQAGPAAEIDDTPREAFIHGNMRFASERIPRIKSGPIAADAFLLSQGFAESLPKRDAAIFDRVVGVNVEIALATQFQVYDRMPGEESEHVIEKRDAGPNGRLALPIDLQIELYSGLFRGPTDLRLTLLHLAELTKPHPENKAQILFERKLVECDPPGVGG